MGKTPGADPSGGNLLTRLTTVMKNSAGGASAKQQAAAVSMSDAGSSDFFIRMALGMLHDSKEAARREPLKAAIRAATAALEASSYETPITIFKPFQIACESGSPELTTIAIDCLGKLFSYNYWGKVAAGYNPTAKDMETGAAAEPRRHTHVQEDQQDDDGDNEGTQGMISFVIETICNGFTGESTDERVQLQIIKALQAALTTTDPAYALHGAILLKAIRTTYNIFLLSKSHDVQIVAQGTVTQMVQNVFGRIPKSPQAGGSASAANISTVAVSKASTLGSATHELGSQAPSSTPDIVISSQSDSPACSLNATSAMAPESSLASSATSVGPISTTADSCDIDLESSKEPKSVPTSSAESRTGAANSSGTPGAKRKLMQSEAAALSSTAMQALKDAFKVLRTLCVLSMKPIPSPEGTMDLRSQPVRSKLLSLHLISAVLSSHTYVFAASSVALNSPKSGHPEGQAITFMEAAKEFLIVSLSRNATSVIPPVFEVSMEIFGKLLLHFRNQLKREVSVFFTEIVIPILDSKKSIPWYQRFLLLACLQRIFGENALDGGRMLVEIYLNYDCDVEASAKENIWERLIAALSKITSQRSDPSVAMPSTPVLSSSYVSVTPGSAPALTTSNLLALSRDQVRDLYSTTGDTREIKRRGLELLCSGILRPLMQWCQSRAKKQSQAGADETERKPGDDDNDTVHKADSEGLRLLASDDANPSRASAVDDPAAFQNLKNRKQLMLEGIKRFNQKPKKGVQLLLDSGCIPSRTPRDIARFLLDTEGLSKAMIGEFLGEGEEENIAIMHAFVDEMDFVGHGFVDALRHFLQSFRLPGEAQKIDRFMLKFAERYLKGNPKAFSSADTAYVLAYSVIMLNTDQHNAQVKRRMTKEDFLKNNRGIDEGKDLPAEFLGAIFDEIQSNEIVMKDEAKAKDGAKAEKSNALGLPVEVDALLFGKPKRRDGPPDISKTTESMALKTEAIFTSILRSKSTVQKSTRKEADGANAAAAQARERIVTAFFSASHYEHVRPMFQLVWMSLLTAISTPLQETEDLSTISVALDGFRSAAYIACIFDMELESKAFISTLGKFTILNNIQEMRAKNFEAIKTLLDIAFQQGNSLGESWKVVVQCISQLEKLQIVGALGEDGPRARGASERSTIKRDQGARQSNRPTLLDEVAAEASSQSMTLSVDRIFTASAKLSGAAIVHFVRALCEMSWEEISSSKDREHPRMYCLQRLVEISYYNMKRIRVEWSNIWAILGQHFNQVGSSPNTTVAFFAVDKLRQLAIKFLELEELPNFKFQKDFLRPFEEIIRSNPDVKIKDMCLACIQQMVQAKSRSLKSGWKTLFGALLRPSRETNEPLVVQAFEIIKSIYKTSFEGILANAAYPEFVGCVVEFCKNAKFGKISLHAIELLRQSIGRVAELLGKGERHVLLNSVAMASTPTQRPDAAFATPSQTAPRPALSDEDASVKFWMPVLFGLQDVIMASELEVRTRALQYLFETLKLHGSTFSRDFWALLAKGVLFPIFDDLKHSGTTSLANSKFASKEEMLVWLSTTLIQALRQLVELFGTHFESLRFMLDGMLEILTTCLTHENEALSRIGSTCLQQLVEHNAQRFEKQEWTKVVELFERLSQDTTPYFLFFDMAQIPGADSQAQQSPLIDPASLDPELAFLKAPLGPPPDKREFQRLIGKCVLHLLVMQTLDETLLAGQSDTVFRSLSAEHMFRLTDCFDHSFRFARAFNKYTSLRTAIYRMGYMKQMPNLLKQETQSVTAYIRCLAKVSLDRSPETSMLREKTEKRLIPLCLDILSQFNSLDGDAKRRNINSWKPVVVIILNALMDLSDDPFSRHIKAFYPGIVNLLLNDITPELRVVLHSLLMRTGVVLSIIEEEEAYQPRSLASGDGTAANTDSAAAASATSAADDGADPMQQADGDDEARQ